MMYSASPVPDYSEFSAIDALLKRAEQMVMLIDRATPKDGAIELARVLEAWRKGRKLVPNFVYQPVPELGELRAELTAAAERHEGRSPLFDLYVERARELEFDARLAQNIGQPEFAVLAAQRFPMPPGDDGAQAAALARGYASLSIAKTEEPLHATDDASDTSSLVSLMRRRVAELGLSVRVEVRPQSAVATVGEGFIGIRPRVWLTAKQAERVVVHETLGHALPRARARKSTFGLLAVGSAKSSETEEGRALLVEERARLLDEDRKRELGLRHIAALSVRRGANFRDTSDELVELGATLELALDLAARVHRGGGLAREIVYLPSYLSVKHDLAVEPALERWLERGRLSIRAARIVAAELK
ncbi:MAG TPA: tyrosine/phenylalanine carboxypeptidase domain-containing protein [Polyangiaceae bacterium]|nr:tyrosine/phenylalanine carboxypeptidase domain-containing protein [Polyangiaceae bacterium]